MNLTWIDLIVFVGFIVTVVVVSLYAGRKERSSEDYFLAGRKLTWWLIGFSLIASNISTEHFVGMSGKSVSYGMAVANWEWMSAPCLVIIAWWLLPRFLSAGIYTMPQFLEYRYDSATRTILAFFFLITYVFILLASVLYSGAIALNAIFDIPALFAQTFHLSEQNAEKWATVSGIWMIGIIAGIYTIYGGLKAVVWSDLLQGSALLIGGAVVAVLGLMYLGGTEPGGELVIGSMSAGWDKLIQGNPDKMRILLPWDHPEIPWIGVLIGGLWFVNFSYWGLNQFITQRTLGAKSLLEGQKGIMFGACLKLLIPFIIVIPGIIAGQMFGDKVAKPDMAWTYMMTQIMPSWLRGAMLAAICGAVMSTFNSGLNSSATIFTIDLYQKYVNPQASQQRLVTTGRITTAIIVLIACSWAPFIAKFGGVFDYTQKVGGSIVGSTVSVFFIGILVKRTPAIAATSAMLLGIPLYVCCFLPKAIYGDSAPDNVLMLALYNFSNSSWLNHMWVCTVILMIYMLVMTWLKPLKEPVVMPKTERIDTTVHPKIYLWGIVVMALTLILYLVFWRIQSNLPGPALPG